MHERASLHAGEYGGIDLFSIFRLAEDHTSTRTSQGLVGRSRYKIRIRHRAGMQPRGDEACYVGHIDHQVSAAVLRNLTESLKIDYAGVCTCTGYDELRFQFSCLPVKLIIVDTACVLSHTVKLGPVITAGYVFLHAVGQMAAVGKIHTQDQIAGFKHCKVYR